jgi:hypothetical protein
MSQHDFIIDNGPGLAVRTDLNAAFAALVGNNAGPIEPTTMYAGMFWLDTTIVPDGLLRQRNQANTAWIAVPVAPATAGSITMTVLTISGTYTKSAGLKFLEVTVVGGGAGGTGAGATAAGQSSAGGGGGGGGTAIKLYPASALASSVAYTVGAKGGAPGGSGAAGGSSSFSGLTGAGGSAPGALNTTGAAAGTTPSPGVSGAGGGASGGDVNIAGGFGWHGMRAMMGVATQGSPGVGGRSHLTEVNSFGFQVIGSTTSGAAGAFPGGGGSGGANGASQSAASGAVGGDGCIILKEYF